MNYNTENLDQLLQDLTNDLEQLKKWNDEFSCQLSQSQEHIFFASQTWDKVFDFDFALGVDDMELLAKELDQRLKDLQEFTNNQMDQNQKSYFLTCQNEELSREDLDVDDLKWLSKVLNKYLKELQELNNAFSIMRQKENYERED